jgi:hypothetical protein
LTTPRNDKSRDDRIGLFHAHREVADAADYTLADVDNLSPEDLGQEKHASPP